MTESSGAETGGPWNQEPPAATLKAFVDAYYLARRERGARFSMLLDGAGEDDRARIFTESWDIALGSRSASAAMPERLDAAAQALTLLLEHPQLNESFKSQSEQSLAMRLTSFIIENDPEALGDASIVHRIMSGYMNRTAGSRK